MEFKDKDVSHEPEGLSNQDEPIQTEQMSTGSTPPVVKKGLTRRQALMAGAAAGASLMAPWSGGARKAMAQNPDGFLQAVTASPPMRPFVDLLPLPAVAVPIRSGANFDRYKMVVLEAQQQLHTDLPAPTTIWGYNGLYPGPTIEARRNRTVQLKVVNRLNRYFLQVDTALGGATPHIIRNPAIATHLHGGNVQPEYDGGPEDRFPPNTNFTYFYPNGQEAATLWFHDHSLGVTRLNVYAGMAAFYLLRDAFEQNLGIPVGLPYEIPMAIQDRTFNADGSLFYPFPWALEFFGDTMLVNGKVWPRHRVQRGWYRLRLLNGCSARFLNLFFEPRPPAGSMFMIGTDGGFLDAPIPVPNPVTPDGQNGLLLAPAERADIMINFGAFAPGTRVSLLNDAPVTFPGGGAGVVIRNVMQFRVGNRIGPFQAPPPAILRANPIVRLDPLTASVTRFLTLTENPANGKTLLNNLEYLDPITETPRAGQVEVWNLINLTPDTHPIHLHQVQFQVLDRQPFDVAAYIAANGLVGPRRNPPITFTGPAVPAAAFESGWKDTVRADVGTVTRIITQFGPFRGKYVWHCHILDHEDNEMMRPLIVT